MQVHFHQVLKWPGRLLLLFDDADLDVAPSDVEGTTIAHAVNLKADETLGVRFQLLLVHQIGDLLTVDPCLDAGALGEHSVLVPLAILEVLVRFEFVCGSHPSSSGFTVDVPRLSAIGSTRFNLDLRTVDSPLRSALGLRANLHA